MMNIKKYIRKTLLLSTALTFISPIAFAMETDGDHIAQTTRTQQLQAQLPGLVDIANRNHPGFFWLSAAESAELQIQLPAADSPILELEAGIKGFNDLLDRIQMQKLKVLRDQLPGLTDIAKRKLPVFFWLSEAESAELQIQLPAADSPILELERGIRGFNDLLGGIQVLKLKVLRDQLPGLVDVANRKHPDFVWLSEAQSAELQIQLPAADSPLLELEAGIKEFRDLVARFQAEHNS